MASRATGCRVFLHDGLHSFLDPNPVFAATRCKTIGEAAAVLEPGGELTLVAAPAWDAQRLRAESGCTVIGCDDVAAGVAELVTGRERIEVAGLDDVPLRFRRVLEASAAEIVPIPPDTNRAKTDRELGAAQQAAAIAEEAYAALLTWLHPGLHEHELVARLDVDVRGRGADDHFVLASISPEGDNVRAPRDRLLEPGDVVNVELSPSVDGQFVQICRTVILGQADPDRRRDYALLIDALARGMATARTGSTVAEVVAALDAPLVAAGLAEYCRPPHIRVRGHGQGLASVAPGDITWDNDTTLDAGMMFTLHPNQRFPKSGYMLCGEPVLVTDEGAVALTQRKPGLDEVTG